MSRPRNSLLMVLVVATVLTAKTAPADSTINTNNKWAWSANAGWIDCRTDPTNGTVVSRFICSGYMYSANVGWIVIGDGTPTNGVRYANVSSDDYGVNVLAGGKLRGSAWCPSSGWISFEDTGDPSIDLLTGQMGGYAWGGNLGWISLYTLQAHVQTDTIAPGLDEDEDGIPDAWELERTNSTTVLGNPADGDCDDDGVPDEDEHAADTNPFDPNDYLRILGLAPTNGNDFVVNWASSPSRLYRLEKAYDLGGAWSDSGLGTHAPDDGTNTARTATETGHTQVFFRVKAVLPLSE